MAISAADAVRIAAASEIIRYDWPGRGIAPPGYIKGMAAAFNVALQRLQDGDKFAAAMAEANTGRDRADALSWYEPRYAAVGMSNSKAGPDTLRHLFVLMMGLGMRESSGQYNEGRDMSASNVSADSAEAGLFQESFDIRRGSPLVAELLNEFRKDTAESLLSIFKEGVRSNPNGMRNWGSGDGLLFQKTSKEKPLYAVLATALGLRTTRTHWGPINRREAQLRVSADEMLGKVQRAAINVPPAPLDPPADLTEAAGTISSIGQGFLQRGSDGPMVERVQAALNKAGAQPPLQPDGQFGGLTEKALISFQVTYGLGGDGIVGPRTAELLDKLLAGEPLPVAQWPTQANCDAFYGNPRAPSGSVASAAWEQANLRRYPPPWKMIDEDSRRPISAITIHRKAYDSLARVFDRAWALYGKSQSEMEKRNLHLFSGSYVFRNIRGSSRLSMHAYGIALDIAAGLNALGEPYNPKKGLPLDFVKLFEDEGWTWGGRWQGRPDAMHFQAARVG